MKGEARYDILHHSWQILLCDEAGRRAVTLTFTEHHIPPHSESEPLPLTNIKKSPASECTLRALAEALQQMGLFPEHPLAGELKATKFHLEDMRTLSKELLTIKSLVNIKEVQS